MVVVTLYGSGVEKTAQREHAAVGNLSNASQLSGGPLSPEMNTTLKDQQRTHEGVLETGSPCKHLQRS